MTEKDFQIRIIELQIALQTQEQAIDCLTRTVARLNYELSQLPGGIDIIQQISAENDDVVDDNDDEIHKATVLKLVKNDDDDDD